jgi:uncharacterized membrane protein
MSPTMPLAELVAPNLHVALIHYPLAMLAAGVMIELFSFLWPRSSFRTAGRWMILLGALAGIPAAFSGIYALRAVARVPLGDDRLNWNDIRVASPVLSDPAIWHQLRNHTLYQSIATGVAAIAAVAWLGMGDGARRAARLPVLGVLVLALGGMMAGAWLGGEAIYKHGTGVERGWPTPVAETVDDPPNRVEGWFPPVELHMIAAGTTVAIAAGAIGLSFRRLALTRNPPLAPESYDPGGHAHLARSFNPNLELADTTAPLPAGRFWLLAFALAAGTSLGGWFVLARSASAFDTVHGQWGRVPAVLWELVRPEKDKVGHWTVSRRFVHFAAGGAITVLPLVLAMLARWAPRQRVLLAALTLILTGAVAAQVWFGVLLLYDQPTGPLLHFNPADADVVRSAGTTG